MLIRQIEDCSSQSHAFSDKPLRPDQWRHLTAAISELVPAWSVELHYDDPDNACIVIMPEGADDALGPTLLVHTEASTFHLDEMRWDRFRKLSEHRGWADVLRAVQIRVIWEMPFPKTLQ